MRPPQAPGLLSRFIDRYSPSVTLLLFVWVVAFEARRYLGARDALSATGYEALTSLIYVVPVMLVGWALLALGRLLGLDLLPRNDQ